MITSTVTSSNIASAAWEDETLYLTFHNGSVYSYAEVPQQVYDDLISAASVGKFFHASIRPHYTATKLNQEEQSVI